MDIDTLIDKLRAARKLYGGDFPVSMLIGSADPTLAPRPEHAINEVVAMAPIVADHEDESMVAHPRCLWLVSLDG
jgi:hypothetical protein